MMDRRRIAVVTGTRSEYGLLRPVMRAIESRSDLNLQTVVAGAHLLPPARTVNEVHAEFEVAATISMQDEDNCRRIDEAHALGRGVVAMAEWLSHAQPDVVLVLGDRIEAFAAAAAASIGGIRVAHMHGGDRAEGIADEAMRHAITKLAHIHLPATERSAHRIIAMGEESHRVHVVGSPAIDELESMPPLSDDRFTALGRPAIALVLHPCGETDEREQAQARQVIDVGRNSGPLLVLHPNHDAGREGIMRAIAAAKVHHVAHLPRAEFVGLLRRIEVLVGNSSAALIEGAAVGVPAVNLGSRQGGREMPANVIDLPRWTAESLVAAIIEARGGPRTKVRHPYGDGRAGVKTAEVLATFDPATHGLRKRNTY